MIVLKGITRYSLLPVSVIEHGVWEVETSCGNQRAYIVDASIQTIAIKGKLSSSAPYLKRFPEKRAIQFQMQNVTERVFHLPDTNTGTGNPPNPGSSAPPPKSNAIRMVGHIHVLAVLMCSYSDFYKFKLIIQAETM